MPCSTHVTAVPDYVQLDNVRVPEEQQKHAVAIESAENGDKSFGFGGEGATVCPPYFYFIILIHRDQLWDLSCATWLG